MSFAARHMWANAAPPSPAASFDDLMAAAGPFSWWKLQESSGTVAVDATGRRNGEYQSATLAAPALRAGSPGCAGFLGGAAQCFVGGDSKIGMMFQGAEASIAFWYRHVANSSQSRLLQYFDSTYYGTGPFRVFEKIYFQVPSDNNVLSLPNGMFDGEPHFAVIQKGPFGYRFYQDGALAVSIGSSAASGMTGGYGFCFPAAGGWDHYPIRAYFSDMALFDRALSASEISALYAAGAL